MLNYKVFSISICMYLKVIYVLGLLFKQPLLFTCFTSEFVRLTYLDITHGQEEFKLIETGVMINSQTYANNLIFLK